METIVYSNQYTYSQDTLNELIERHGVAEEKIDKLKQLKANITILYREMDLKLLSFVNDELVAEHNNISESIDYLCQIPGDPERMRN